MAEFFEVPIQREDGSEGLHYVNIEAISYVNLETDAGQESIYQIQIYLNNGYWFTLSGPKATEFLGLVKNRICVSFREHPGNG